MQAPTTASPVNTEEAQTKAKLTQPHTFRLRAKSRLTSDPTIRITMLASMLANGIHPCYFPINCTKGMPTSGATTQPIIRMIKVESMGHGGSAGDRHQGRAQEDFLRDVKHPSEGDQRFAQG